jgi:hypothetical protein
MNNVLGYSIFDYKLFVVDVHVKVLREVRRHVKRVLSYLSKEISRKVGQSPYQFPSTLFVSYIHPFVYLIALQEETLEHHRSILVEVQILCLALPMRVDKRSELLNFGLTLYLYQPELMVVLCQGFNEGNLVGESCDQIVGVIELGFLDFTLRDFVF